MLENNWTTKGKVQELIDKTSYSLTKTNDSITVGTKYFWIGGDGRRGIYRGAINPSFTGTGALKQSGTGEYMVQTSTGLTAGSTASWYSARGLRSAPNSESFIMFSGCFSEMTSIDGYQKVGFYDSDDGFFIGIEYNSTTDQNEFCITTRLNGTDTKVFQSDFNLNVLDYIDFTKPQIIKIGFANGFGSMYFEIACGEYDCNYDEWVKFHKIRVVNEKDEAVIARYQLPIRFEVSNGSVDEDVYINLLEMGAGTIDGHLVDYSISDRRFDVDVIKTTPSGVKTNYVIGALRNPTTYQGYLMSTAKGNYTQFNIDHLSYSFVGQNKSGVLRALQVPQSLNLTGTFNQVQAPDSISQWSTDATYNLTDPTQYTSFLSESIGTGVVNYSEILKDLLLEHIPGYDIVLTYTTPSTIAIDITSTMRYSEQW